MSIEIGSRVKVLVQANKHANLDSLALRYGFYFSEDTLLDVKIRSRGKTSTRPGRQVYFVEFENPELDQLEQGEAVISDHLENGHPVLISIWRHDVDTEHYLSSVIKDLRESGDISSAWLKSMHRYYRSGQLSTHSDLLRHLVASNTVAVAEEIQQKADSAVQKAEQERAKAIAELDEYKAQEKESKPEIQPFENAAIKQNLERENAARRGSKIAVSEGVVLQSVRRDVMHRGSLCTVLELSDGSERYMKTSTFDPSLTVTSKAESLIGSPVRITHWDPIDKPGYWSSQGYFRNVYPD